jgi:hypothetical protein
LGLPGFACRYRDGVEDIGKSLGKGARSVKKLLPEGWHGDLTNVGEYYDFYVNDTDLYQNKGNEREAWRFALVLMRQQPSFARIRRLWETTREFWLQVEQGLPGLIDEMGPRLQITGKKIAAGAEKEPGPFHSYELALERGLRLNVAWDGQRFITAANLIRAAGMLDWDGKGAYLDHLKSAISGRIPIQEPVGYGGPTGHGDGLRLIACKR